MSAPTVSLVYGPIGSGKSTYAMKLASEKNAIHFAIDEWMHALFADDRPEKMDMAWAMSRVARCEAHIWSVCTQILASGRDVVLELGSTMREKNRSRMREIVEAAGHQISFYFVDANPDIRRQRVRQRNADKGETYSFEVTPSMFEAMDQYFERPTEQELSRSVAVSGEDSHG